MLQALLVMMALLALRELMALLALPVLLVLVHFFIPLFCLIMTSISKNLIRLSWVAALMIVAHFAQVIWWIEPAFGRQFHIPFLGVVLIVAVGEIWLANYARNLAAPPLMVEELLVPMCRHRLPPLRTKERTSIFQRWSA